MLNSIKNIHWLRRLHQWYWQKIRVPSVIRWMCWRLRKKYRQQEERVRKAFRIRPLRVLFPISSLAKWKMQTIFDLMYRSKLYEPIVALTVFDVEKSLAKNDKKIAIAAVRNYCIERHMAYVETYDVETDSFSSFEQFEPDVVWYQDPWEIDKIQSPERTSDFALTCYVPYFVQNYGYLRMDCLQSFHRYIWRHFTLNDQWAKIFMEEQDRTDGRVGEVVGLGHPMIDLFNSVVSDELHEKLVIYAPHWSCGIGERYSTFLEYGEQILTYAQNHPEVKWAFKPHPTLRRILIDVLGHSENTVDAYYDAWGKIGDVCLDGDYVRLFKRSCALVTDCASFLIEYACTGKPIIRLVSRDPQFPPHPISQGLLNSYYNAHSWADVQEYLDRIVLHGDDFRQQERLSAIGRMNLNEKNAAVSIVDYLNRVFSEDGSTDGNQLDSGGGKGV